jgi:uncharacterized membrane-anchored protein YjiN (DUF445 family)
MLPETVMMKLLQGGFEAGLVGGIADWFAVTALFRHPFGIPIPHTSLLIKNRDKIVNSLISAMETELLKKESITRQLQGVNLLRTLASAAARLVAKRSVRVKVIRFAISILRQIPLDKLAVILQTYLVQYVKTNDLKPLTERLVSQGLKEGWDEKALDYAVAAGLRWVERPETEQMLGRLAHDKLKELQVGGLMGFAVQAFAGYMSEDKLGSMLQNMIHAGISELSYEHSTTRGRLLSEIRVRLQLTAENEAFLSSVKAWISGKLEQPEALAFMQTRLEEFRIALVDKLEAEERRGGRLIVTGFRLGITKLNGMKETTEQWEQSLLNYLVHIVEQNHYRIGELVRDNLNQMDNQSLIRMLEEKIGSDLQWIRVNGALCGFLVGIFLTLFRL